MRKLSALILVVALLSASNASAVVDLTTPISIPNIQKWKVVQLFDHDDRAGTENDPKYAVVLLEILGTGSLLYRTSRLIIKDAPNLSTVLSRSATATSYDKFIVETEVAVPGAYTAIMAAYDGASGKVAKRKAVEVALVANGLMVDLAGTYSLR